MPGSISHDVPIDSISSYSKIGQEEGRLLFNLKAGFADSTGNHSPYMVFSM